MPGREKYWKNHERTLSYARAYRLKNREKLNREMRLRAQLRRAADPEKARNYTRRQQGNTEPELVPALLELQQHLCAICLKDLSQAPGRDVGADHAHGSGRMRGMLCRRCNAGLGHFKDDPLRLRLAVEYLRSPPRERLP